VEKLKIADLDENTKGIPKVEVEFTYNPGVNVAGIRIPSHPNIAGLDSELEG
jgi:hypothetical protein